MANVGRPRALDEVKRREICALMSAGCGIEGAARYVGCSPSTIRREALRNVDFHQALRSAELSSQLDPLRAMRRAASTHWRAAAWLLERTNPQRFARQEAKTLRYDELEETIDRVVEVIADELAHEPHVEAIYRRLLAVSREALAEASAARRPRRDARRARRFLDHPRDQAPLLRRDNS